MGSFGLEMRIYHGGRILMREGCWCLLILGGGGGGSHGGGGVEEDEEVDEDKGKKENLMKFCDGFKELGGGGGGFQFGHAATQLLRKYNEKKPPAVPPKRPREINIH